MNLVKVINLIKADINKLENERKKQIEIINKQFDEKIEKLTIALQVNMDLNTICIKCEGKGRISYLDAAGDTDHKVCDRCNGTKLEPKEQTL
jgi:superfamily II helicase